METIKNAIFSNTFDPDTEIPDLSSKVNSLDSNRGSIAHAT